MGGSSQKDWTKIRILEEEGFFLEWGNRRPVWFIKTVSVILVGLCSPTSSLAYRTHQLMDTVINVRHSILPSAISSHFSSLEDIVLPTTSQSSQLPLPLYRLERKIANNHRLDLYVWKYQDPNPISWWIVMTQTVSYYPILWNSQWTMKTCFLLLTHSYFSKFDVCGRTCPRELFTIMYCCNLITCLLWFWNE